MTVSLGRMRDGARTPARYPREPRRPYASMRGTSSRPLTWSVRRTCSGNPRQVSRQPGVLGEALDPRHHRQAARLDEGHRASSRPRPRPWSPLEQSTDAGRRSRPALLTSMSPSSSTRRSGPVRSRLGRRSPGRVAEPERARRSPPRSRSGRSSGRANRGGRAVRALDARRPRACRRDRTRPRVVAAPAPAASAAADDAVAALALDRAAGSRRELRRPALCCVNRARTSSRVSAPRATPSSGSGSSTAASVPDRTPARKRRRAENPQGVSSRCRGVRDAGSTYQRTKYTPATIAAMIAATRPS